MNPLLQNEYIVLLAVIGASVLLTAIVKFVLKSIAPRLKSWAQNTSFKWDDILVNTLAITRGWFFFGWIFFSAVWAVEKLEPDWNSFHVLGSLGRVVIVIVTSLQIIFWGLQIIAEWREAGWSKKNSAATAAFGLLYTTIQALFIVSIVLIGLSNLGVNIGALVTGLGIGGVAVALAAQNILGDFFASLSIVLDKPFVNGDYIAAGKEEGEVENIGIKTTRVRSVSGEELIFSNKDLLESRIHNYKRMHRRRVAHDLKISTTIAEEKLRQFPKWIADLFPRYDKLTFDRCHLASFGESALNFQLVFWVEDSNHQLYMDLQQKLLFDIYAILKREGIEFGTPQRILHFGDNIPAQKYGYAQL